MAYVEGNSDWTCETCLDITRELDRSNDYSGNESGIDRLGPMNCNDKIVNRSLDTQAYSPFGFLAQLNQLIDFTVSKRASQEHPVPLDPGNLPALDLRIVKWQVATPSHVRPSRVPGKRELAQTRAELQRRDQELVRANAALERSRKRARGVHIHPRIDTSAGPSN
ncbi:hypothetical protein CRG98_026928 [Punica granatum]|uniref:Uncharacterized protein n=1 Tax=Punica granatum TaxID=22663 RepID=A0A2I0J8W9_PUNGR|nr:hypothetical protein CRG98_026928 [Punica granatum]